jgi:hypothetical protein
MLELGRVGEASGRHGGDSAKPVSQASPVTIDKDRKLMTLVKVFTVSRDKQMELADLLVGATGSVG